ncbi:MAG: hypothetical protein OEM82_10520 [Acidobacteriota bacterium]|nr:hypothetical protein [Acidobacteriota bacterium]MDH3528514.1 hypothetical protein [Acidobacteriota bacterium]
MTQEITRYEVTSADLRKDKLLKIGGYSLPLASAAIGGLIFFIPFLFSSTIALSGMFLILSVIGFGVGLLLGAAGSAATFLYRNRWLAKIRDRVAIDGIRAGEVKWFWNEMKGEEKRALKEIESKNLMLADAYQETLASRLTATRIIKSTNRELLLARRRKNKLRYLKSERLEDFKSEIDKDIENLANIKKEASEMQVEAESRLQMIEAASRRGAELAGNEIALRKLSARTEELPLALEAARMEEEIRRELEAETKEILDEEFSG